MYNMLRVVYYEVWRYWITLFILREQCPGKKTCIIEEIRYVERIRSILHRLSGIDYKYNEFCIRLCLKLYATFFVSIYTQTQFGIQQ